MTLNNWLLFLLIIQVIHFAGTWKLYQKAGRKAWEAAVPVYNAVILMKIINRPWWWVILMFIPIVNQIMIPVVWVETIRSFGRNSNLDTLLVIITLGLYIYYVNYGLDVKYIEDRNLKPRTGAGEWISSILFAVVAATIVHTYFMQPYTIPTSSLEGTLLVGDFLFVSKYHYGARTPITPISMPMVHDTIPVLKKKSYAPKLQVPHFRVPGFQKIKNNDIVVFSWPVDTINAFYGKDDGRYHYKPIDKKSNYVKRAVGIPGDSIELRNGYVYVNGEQNVLPERAKLQFGYYIVPKANTGLNQRDIDFLKERFEVREMRRIPNSTAYVGFMPESMADKVKEYTKIEQVVSVRDGNNEWDPSSFPYDERYEWNANNYGPIYIPEAGKTVSITPETISFYKRIIEVYEGSELGIDNVITQSGTQVLLNGEPISEYTFKMDYYWLVGDNRNNSEDSRVWGYVPFNHVVGKPVFVWMSWENGKPRWERWFTTVGGSGQPVSYFRYFLIALAGYFVFNFFWKRRKKGKKA